MLFSKSKNKQDESDLGASKYLRDKDSSENAMEEQETLMEGKEQEIRTFTELQEMSMPELWKLASDLGISKNGKKDKLIKRILNAQKAPSEAALYEREDVPDVLNQLKDDLKEFEKIKEGMKKKVESTYKTIPKLTEKQSTMKKDVQKKERQIDEIENLIPKLETERHSLESDLSRTLEELERQKESLKKKQQKAKEINVLIPKLNRNKRNIQKNIEKIHDEIAKTEDQIQQILSIQKCSMDLLSALMHSTKKNGR